MDSVKQLHVHRQKKIRNRTGNIRITILRTVLAIIVAWEK